MWYTFVTDLATCIHNCIIFCLIITPCTQHSVCCLQVVCPDVILVGYDALVSDIAQLQEVDWEVAVLDERECVPSTLAKAHQALREINCFHKLLLSPGNPAGVSLLLIAKPMYAA